MPRRYAPAPPPAAPGEPLLLLHKRDKNGSIGPPWRDQIVVHGLGSAEAMLTLYAPAGSNVRRRTDQDPAAQLVGARLEPALAGKVVGEGGLLVLTWRLGGTEIAAAAFGPIRRTSTQPTDHQRTGSSGYERDSGLEDGRTFHGDPFGADGEISAAKPSSTRR